MSSFGYNVLGFGSSATVGSGSYGSSAVEIGTIPNTASGVYYVLAVSPNFSESNVVYALRSTGAVNGSFDILKSTDASENWTTQISGQAGNGSSYGFDIKFDRQWSKQLRFFSLGRNLRYGTRLCRPF